MAFRPSLRGVLGAGTSLRAAVIAALFGNGEEGALYERQTVSDFSATQSDLSGNENDATLSGDTYSVTLPDLGTDATVAYATPESIVIVGGQMVSGSTDLADRWLFYVIVDRALTTEERETLVNWMGSKGATEPDYFVDSVNGSDANDGLTIDAPLQSIAALDSASVGAGDHVGFVGDSSWREQYRPDVSVAKIAYPGLAKLDGADIISPGDFSLSSHPDAGTNTYEVALSVDPDSVLVSGDTYMMWEDDAWLVRKTSVADVEATAGTYYVASPNAVIGTPTTAYVHPFGSTNPISDGKTYEATRRAAGIELAAIDGVTVEGVHATRGLSAYGVLPMGNGTVRRCLLSKCGKHNIVQAAGLIEDTICFDAEIGRSVLADGGLIPFTFYKPDATGLDWTIRRGMSIAPTGRGISSGAVYAHGSSGQNHNTGTVDKFISLRGGAVEGVQEEQYLTDVCTLDVPSGRAILLGANSSIIRLSRALIRSDPAPNSPEINHPSAGAITGADVEIADCALHKPAAGGISGAFLIISTTSLVNAHHNTFRFDEGSGLNMQNAQSGSRFERNIVLINKTGTVEYLKVNPNLSLDYNVYIDCAGATDYWWQAGAGGSGTAFTLSEWQSESGQDANSVVLNATQADDLFLNGVAGIANGDFRLDPACTLEFGDGSLIVDDCGPRTHYNWNTRQVDDGAPFSWPTPPETLAECETYIGHPEAWDFYP